MLTRKQMGKALVYIGGAIMVMGFVLAKLSPTWAIIIVAVGLVVSNIGAVMDHFSKPYDDLGLYYYDTTFLARILPRTSQEAAAVIFGIFFILALFFGLFWWQDKNSFDAKIATSGLIGMPLALQWYRNRWLPWSHLLAMILIISVVVVFAWKVLA